MPVLTPIADVGARSKPNEMTVVDPARLMPQSEAEQFLTDTGLNGPFLADLLSNMAAHERCGIHLYRSVIARTQNPILKRKYTEIEAEEVRHLEILEDLITGLGGDPLYVSPIARATEKADSGMVESTFMLAGSVNLMDQEMVMLDAVFLAEAKDNSNWAALAALLPSFPEGEVQDLVRTAVEEAQATEAEHLEWANDMRVKLVGLQASSSAMTAMGVKAEEMMARIQDWFA